MANSNYNTRTFPALILLTALIFVIGLFIPLGIAIGTSYVLVVLLSYWLSKPLYTYITAAIVSVLVILGFFLAPPGERMSVVLTNRFLSLFVIWVVAIFIVRYKKLVGNLEENEEKLNSVFNTASEAIIVVDQQGHITMANNKAEKIFGYSREELVGRTVEALIPGRFHNNHIEHRRQYTARPSLRSMGMGRELFAIRKNGEEFPVEISLSYFRTKTNLLVTCFVVDITERKKAEEALRQANANLRHYTRELARSNEELEQFAYVSSHDLQEPLRKIQAFGERLKSKEQLTISDESKDFLNRMLNAASRMQRLINDLLLFSRITSNAKPFETVNLNTTLSEVLSDLMLVIEKNNATIHAEELPVIEADPTQMHQLFQNLIGNAVKFHRSGTPPVIRIYTKPGRPEEKITGSSRHDVIEIYFEDNGIGFDEKYVDRIFTIFQRLEGQKFEGSGIGLAVCKKIASRHGGHISVKSKIGEGTTFIVALGVKHS